MSTDGRRLDPECLRTQSLSRLAKWLYSEVKMAIERKFASEPTMLQYLSQATPSLKPAKERPRGRRASEAHALKVLLPSEGGLNAG